MAMSMERKIERAAFRKREKELSRLISVAHQIEVFDQYCSTSDLYIIRIQRDGVELKGLVRDVNPVLEKLGYRPVRVTSNMLNPSSKPFCIDINTPSYCDPGCESYHSM